MKSGDTFLMPAPGISNRKPHLWIVVTDATNDSQLVIIVNITSLRRGAEQTMILRKGDHPFIVTDSSVSYSDAQIVEASDLDAMETAGQIKVHHPCSAKTLNDIRAGLRASDRISKRVQRFYEDITKGQK